VRTQRAPVPTRPDARHVRRGPARPPTVADSWAAMPWSLRILRAFLGITFVYAGMNKFLDANFLHRGGADYIGSQLQAVLLRGTPIAPLIRLFAAHPLLIGLGVALTELAVGLCTLLGIGMLTAAALGFTINLVLWLSFSWHQHPYFLGSDSIYAVAWLALGFGILESSRAAASARLPALSTRVDDLGRREFLRAGLVGSASLLLGMLGLVFAGAPTRSSGLGGARAAGPGTGTGTGTRPTTPPAGPTEGGASAAPPPGRVIATMQQLPPGGAVGFVGPGNTPAACLRLRNGEVVAYSRICTHAGCEVGYSSSSELLICPCHGAEFDPARNGAPVPGSPTSVPLPAIRVEVDKATGQVILPPGR